MTVSAWEHDETPLQHCQKGKNNYIHAKIAAAGAQQEPAAQPIDLCFPLLSITIINS